MPLQHGDLESGIGGEILYKILLLLVLEKMNTTGYAELVGSY
jgi:hypothetical protein